MSVVKSDNSDLTINASGSTSDIKFQANGVEKASISSAGLFTSTTIDATKLTGNLPAISGASLTGVGAVGMDDVSGVARATSGLLFNGDTASANKLDDYEEGSWTPTLGGNATYSVADASYTKIGDVVTLRMRLIVSAIGTGSTTTISGAPFANCNVSRAGFPIVYFASIATNAIYLTGWIDHSVSAIKIAITSSSSSAITDTPAIFGNNTHIQFIGSYTLTNK